MILNGDDPSKIHSSGTDITSNDKSVSLLISFTNFIILCTDCRIQKKKPKVHMNPLRRRSCREVEEEDETCCSPRTKKSDNAKSSKKGNKPREIKQARPLETRFPRRKTSSEQATRFSQKA